MGKSNSYLDPDWWNRVKREGKRFWEYRNDKPIASGYYWNVEKLYDWMRFEATNKVEIEICPHDTPPWEECEICANGDFPDGALEHMRSI